jgi:5'(3')-deoxyribonucleotidase
MEHTALCFVDMDGVLADFVKGACEAHGRPSPYVDPKSVGIFDMDKLWKMSAQEFWRPLERDGFWRELEILPDARELVEMLCKWFKAENVCVLTAPSLDPRCIPEKRAWIAANFPALAKNMLFGSAKRFLAGQFRWLIDDRNENIDNFVNHGGIGVLYPQVWNRNHKLIEQRLQYVRSKI